MRRAPLRAKTPFEEARNRVHLVPSLTLLSCSSFLHSTAQSPTLSLQSTSMDALERIKAFHNEQFEEVEVCAPTFRGAPNLQAWSNDPRVLNSYLFQDPDAHVGAFIETCRGSTCALVGASGVFFVLDSRGYDVFTGHKCGREDGRAVILRLEGLSELLRFLRSLIGVGQTATLSQVYF